MSPGSPRPRARRWATRARSSPAPPAPPRLRRRRWKRRASASAGPPARRPRWSARSCARPSPLVSAVLGPRRFQDPGDDVGGGRARGEDLGHAHLRELGDVGVRDDAAAEHHDVRGVLLVEQFDEAGEERHMSAGQHRKADRVHVLLDGGRHDLLRCLVQAGVDDLDAGVAQRARHYLRAPVVAVQSCLGHDDADPARCICHSASRNQGSGGTGGQYTQGIPYGAFGLTVTAPPLAPLLWDGLSAELDGDGEPAEAAGGEPDAGEGDVSAAGTAVASVPSSTSTWPAATVESGLAVTSVKYPAIFCAAAAAPAP